MSTALARERMSVVIFMGLNVGKNSAIVRVLVRRSGVQA
jgi:hypothetical protein